MDREIIIVGAGPTGLVLALWLARLGIPLRIVDKAAGPGKARTLELYRQVGLAYDVVRSGIEIGGLNLWARGSRRARVQFGRMGAGLSPFPYVLDYPQDEHERLLIERLSGLGVRVERNVEVTHVEDAGGRARVRMRGPDGDRTCEARFVAGCDGAHSTVREALGVGFPGGTYEHSFYVADVDAEGPAIDGQLHICLDDNDFVGVFPLKRKGHVRLIGIVHPVSEGHDRKELSWDDVSKQVLQRMRIEVREVRWFSTYKVHHRVAAQFRRGRVFLLGDAAHVHSPVGGQGMNTGIGDAVNLAWKLAAVVRERAPERILDSYEPERIGFARRLTATTDRIFQLVTRPSRAAALVRVDVVPPMLALLFRLPAWRRYMFRVVSQTAIEYRKSKLSEGQAGSVHGGDRLPWVEGANGDNFAPLESLDWQVHVHGQARRPLAEACASRALALHQFEWSEAAARAGLARGASYLVRPDGYVALADPLQSASRLERYLDGRGLRFQGAHAPAGPVEARPQ